MQVQVLSKVGGSTETIDGSSINLQSPSIVRLKIAPEAVRSYGRQGADLKLVLLNGETVLIQNFFVQDDNGNRSDLVLEDDAGVFWWGQYSTPWSEFHFTEIETDTPLSPWWLLPALGLLGLAAGSGGGGGGGNGEQPARPQPPVIEINNIKVIVDPKTGDTATITGSLTVPPGTVPHTVTVTVEGVEYPATVNEDGTWTVTVPAEKLTEDTPVSAIGTVRNPQTGEVSDPSEPGANIIPIQFTPEADSPAVTTDEDEPVTGKVVGTDKDGDPLTYTIPDIGKPSNGTVVIDPKTGEYTYTPNPDFNGNDKFTVTVSDGRGGVTTVTVQVTINPVNDAPSGADNTVTLPEDGTYTFSSSDFGFNDPVEGDALKSVIITTLPTAGELAFNGVPVTAGQSIPVQDLGQLVFTPAADSHGLGYADFTFQVTDDGGTANDGVDTDPVPKTITINVTPVVDIADDAATTYINTEISLPVLDNDSFEDGDRIITHVGGQPITVGNSVSVDNGTVTLEPDGSLTFEPTTDWIGGTSFTYTVTSGGVTETATVNVNVVGVDIVDNSRPGTPGTGDNVLASIDDLENVTINGHAPIGGTITGLTVTDGATIVNIDPATITVNSDGSFSTTTDLSGLVDGTLTVTLDVKDSGGNDRTTTDTIVKDTAVEVVINPLLVVNGEVPTITGNSEGAQVQLTINGATVTVVVNPDGSWSHTPAVPLTTGKIVISASTVDEWGNPGTAEREIVILSMEDQVSSDAAHVIVYESGLDNGSNGSASSESVNAFFTLDTSEGDIAHIVIGGSVVDGQLSGGEEITLSQLKGLPGTPIPPILTEYGSLVITGYDAATGVVGYTYTLNQNTTVHDVTGDDIVRESIQLAVVDSDGDTRVDQLVVAVVDDVPEANDDTAAIPADSYIAVTGNVITGVGGADVPGADGATVTHINYGSSDITVPTDGSIITINGTYGVLTIQADGTYSYERNPSTDGGVSDVFTYTLTDGDGDLSTATLTVEIGDAAPAVTLPELRDVTTTVYESGLTGGTDTTAGRESVSGSFSFTSGDGVQSLSVHGSAIVANGVPVATPITITTPLGHTLVINGYSFDTATDTGTVDYTYTLNDVETHATQGNDALTEAFAIVMTDLDGDLAPAGNLVLTIIDDMPVITQPAGPLPDLAVSEAGGSLGASAEADFSTAFEYEVGADGHDSHVYALLVDDADSGLVDVATGNPIVLVANANGTIITGHVGNESGAVAFTITINPASGEVTLTQARALAHGDSDATDSELSIASGALGLTLSVTDNDGDTTTSTISDIGGQFTFKDDTPSIDVVTPGNLGSAQLDETGLVGNVDGSISVTVNDFANGVFGPQYGSDGAAALNGLVYTLAVGSADVDSGLVDTETGELILLRMNGDNTVEGYTATGDELVFTVSVDGASGALTLTQYRAIEHGDTDNHNESTLGLGAGLIQLIATVTDGDGDTAAASVSIGENISFLDDGPAVGAPTPAQVDEAHLPLGSDEGAGPLTVTGSLDVTVSADGIDAQFSQDTTAWQARNLTSGGTGLVYEVSSDGHTFIATAGAGGPVVFVATITDPSLGTAGYELVLSGSLDHAGTASLDLGFDIVVTDGDGDTADGSFTVTVLDDVPQTAKEFTVAEDIDGHTFNTTSDATTTNTVIYQGGNPLAGVDNSDGGKDYKTENATVTVNENGTVTYTPDAHYSGTEIFEYVTTDGTQTNTTTVTMTVTPVSDQPTLSVDAADINTLEDTAVALGLNAPVIVDNGTGAGNDATSERLGLITLSGFPDGAVLQYVSESHTFTSGGANQAVTILISDAPTVTDLVLPPGTLTITQAQFEALQVLPPEHSHQNFTVTMTVSSFEVDGAGNIATVDGLPVPGAQSTTSVDVHVQAVTDDAELTFDTSITTGIPNVQEVAYDSDTKATITLNEDTSFTLNDILLSQFEDIDGSEVRSITITNTTGQDILVNGSVLAADGKIEITALSGSSGQTGNMSSFPAITIGGVGNFSGDLKGIQITLNAEDIDADGYWSGSDVGAGPGVPEANTENNTVTLDLQVKPVAGDVAASNVETLEDTAVAFLASVAITDRGTGNEIIDSVSFAVPTGWTLAAPPSSAGWSLTDTGTIYTIAFDGTLSQEAREAVLDSFVITPPAHSSADATIALSITTTDTNTVNGAPVSNTATVTRNVDIKVTPVAEVIAAPGEPGHDTDGDTNPDLTMTPGRVYDKTGVEDEWFGLGTDDAYDALPAFELAAGWSNQDGSKESTFARLTPELTAGDGSRSDAIGAQFKWIENGETKTATYTGSPIDVPMESLATLEFMAPPDFSGQFRIEVRAVTIDYDDDDNTPSAEAVSEPVYLTNVLILPAADAVTLAVNGRAVGLEDTATALTIRPSSSDASETFRVTISDIPVGAVITYGSGTDLQTFTATAGNQSFEIENFKSDWPLSILPPENSNQDFTLTVSAVSIDTLTVDGETYTSESVSQTLSIDVAVKGLADPVVVTPLEPDWSEADLDAGLETVLLSKLVEFAMTDTDGSETLTVRVSGLPDGFSLSGGTLLPPLNAVGEDRLWLLTKQQFDAATISVPANYSGKVTFQVAPVTTENDGGSLTGGWNNISFTVTPSPEATVTTSANIVEDELTSLGFNILHQNGDLDETLGNVRIKISDAAGPNFTLYLGDGADAVTLADALTAGTISLDLDDSTYYLLTPEQALSLAAVGGMHLDGVLDGFDFQYQIIDGHYGEVSSGTPITSDWQDGRFTIDATPVTDLPSLSITEIAGEFGSTVISDAMPGDDAIPDTAALSAADTVTVTLNIASPDYDGSEQLIRIVIEGVPDGVSVTGAEYIGSGSWLLVYEGANALSINADGGIALPVEFVVSPYAGGLNSEIRLTAQVQDRGDTAGQTTEVLSDSVSWHLTTTFTGGDGEDPAVIDEWAYNGTPAAEDTSFILSDIITGSVTVHSTQPNTFTIRLEELPEGTVVTGMTRTTVVEGGQSKVVWTASVTSTSGMLPEDIEALLGDLMGGITLAPPANTNANGSAPFDFTASLSTSVAGGGVNETETISPTVPVDPRTDEATFAITLDTETDAELDESDESIPITLTISNPADGEFGSIVGGLLYLQIEADPGLEGGTLTVDGIDYVLETVSGVSGIVDGQYYVVQNVAMGDELKLVYTPENMTAGNVTVNTWVRNVEQNDDSTGAEVVSGGTGIVSIQISNDGVEIATAPTVGKEAVDATKDSLIELTGLGITLIDDDNSESIISILLSNLPDGFLVFTGVNANDAIQADMSNNAGGTAGYNTWVISNPDGSLPAYVGILPPAYWSGTLDDLKLIVESGEATLPDTHVDEQLLAPIVITPVANGIQVTPTTAFGRENTVISLNLNSSMQDVDNASISDSLGNVIALDGSVETASLQITGLGEYASFYLGNVLIHGYDDIKVTSSGSGAATVYTITGLSQEDLDVLGVQQARSALADQDSVAGVQIKVEAWTVESGGASGEESAHSEGLITLNISNQLGTTGNDTLIWTGNLINAGNGNDTVQMRYGEDLTGAQLAAQLRGVEIIDMNIGGANNISSLTPEQLKAIVGASGSSLKIFGTDEDGLSLSGNWVDNDNGSYTGTLFGGGSVTLTVDGGVSVDTSGVVVPEEAAAQSLATFGLAYLINDDTDPDNTFLFGDDGDQPILSMVLQPLPEAGPNIEHWLSQGVTELGQAPAEVTATGSEADLHVAYAPEPMSLEDELQHDLHGGMVVG